MDSAWMPRWRVGAMASDVLTSSMYTEDGPIPPADLKRLARWDGEVLFLAGACNTVTGADLQRQHMKLFAGPALRIIPNAGHTLIGEQTELTLSAIREYLQREPRSLHFF